MKNFKTIKLETKITIIIIIKIHSKKINQNLQGKEMIRQNISYENNCDHKLIFIKRKNN